MGTKIILFINYGKRTLGRELLHPPPPTFLAFWVPCSRSINFPSSQARKVSISDLRCFKCFKSMLLRNYTKQRHMFLVSCPSLIKMLPLHAAASFSADVRSDLLIPAEVRVGHSAVSFIPFYSCTAEANCPILQVDIKLT